MLNKHGLLICFWKDVDWFCPYLDFFFFSSCLTFESLDLVCTGVIRNTEPLDYEKNHNHILQVVAFDCGMKRSEPVLVSVKVNRVCRLGWTGKCHFRFSFSLVAIVLFCAQLDFTNLITYLCCFFFLFLGISERVEYVPGSGRQDLFPEALINLCDFPCQPESIQARLTLASSHLGKNCDRDTYTIQVDIHTQKR